MLYFASNGRSDTLGNLDVYVSDINNETPTTPVHLDTPINTESNDFSFIINDEKTKGYISSNRDHKKNNDMYSFTAEGLKSKECIQEIVGIVKDKDTNENIKDAVITLFDESNNELEQVKTDEQGVYKIALDCDKTYNFTALAEAYETEEYTLSTDKQYDATIEANKFLIKKILETSETNHASLEDLTSTINQVQFGFDQYKITSEAKKELDKVWNILENNENIQVEISAYTDARGSEEYNLKLSERRANAATEYLVTQGVDSNRIVSIGYGESKLINKCSDGVQCSEAAHQENRRIEFSFTNL